MGPAYPCLWGSSFWAEASADLMDGINDDRFTMRIKFETYLNKKKCRNEVFMECNVK